MSRNLAFIIQVTPPAGMSQQSSSPISMALRDTAVVSFSNQGRAAFSSRKGDVGLESCRKFKTRYV